MSQERKCDWCPPKLTEDFPRCFQLYPGINISNNPGSIQELHIQANRIKPQFFDGLVLDYFHRLAPNKMITANWTLSHNQPGGFRFGGIYTARIHDNILQTPTIHADINPSTMSTNVGIVYFPFRSLRLQAELQRAVGDGPLQTQSTIEYRGALSTLTLNFYDVSPSSGRATISFLRSATKHLALGGELLLEWTEPTSIMADTAFAARYRRYNSAIATTVSRQGIDVSYWHRLNKKVQMATSFAWQRKTQKTVGTICYRWDFEDAFVKGMFDSNLSVGFMYNRNIAHLPVSAAMSLLINLHTNRFIFGLKFILDPSGLQRDSHNIYDF